MYCISPAGKIAETCACTCTHSRFAEAQDEDVKLGWLRQLLDQERQMATRKEERSMVVQQQAGERTGVLRALETRRGRQALDA